LGKRFSHNQIPSDDKALYFDYLQVMIIKDSVSSSVYIQPQMLELRSCRRKWWWHIL